MVFLHTCEIKYSFLSIRTCTYFLLITSEKYKLLHEVHHNKAQEFIENVKFPRSCDTIFWRYAERDTQAYLFNVYTAEKYASTK